MNSFRSYLALIHCSRSSLEKKIQRKGNLVQDTLRKKPEPLILQSKHKCNLEVFQKIALYSLESRVSSVYCWTTINHFLVHLILLEFFFKCTDLAEKPVPTYPISLCIKFPQYVNHFRPNFLQSHSSVNRVSK